MPVVALRLVTVTTSAVTDPFLYTTTAGVLSASNKTPAEV